MILPPAANLLLRNNGDGTFTDQTAASGLTDARDASDGKPKFYTPPAGESKRRAESKPGTAADEALFKIARGQFAVVPTDFDNRRDVDLFTADKFGVTLWRNMRDGAFRDVAASVGLVADELKDSTRPAAGEV